MELQSTLVYGPVQSRRLGRSLGVNLGPAGRKACNFNCAYCQYGWTNFPAKGSFPRPADVIDALDCALQRDPDVESITVAGNGEPTLHPGFAPIAEGIFKVRQRRAPGARLALLSNGSTLNRLDVVYSLGHFDERYMKLDAGDPITYSRINGPGPSVTEIVDSLAALPAIVIQAMFVREAAGRIDNTTDGAVAEWLAAIERVKPVQVHLYTIDRAPACATLRPTSECRLREIAEQVRSAGIHAEVFPSRARAARYRPSRRTRRAPTITPRFGAT